MNWIVSFVFSMMVAWLLIVLVMPFFNVEINFQPLKKWQVILIVAAVLAMIDRLWSEYNRA